MYPSARREVAMAQYGSDEDEDQQQQQQRRGEEEEVEDDRSTSSTSASTKPSFHVLTTRQLEQWVTRNNQIDVGSAGNVVWSVSSAKHGNGVRHLIHYHDLNTFWQSDGVLPHVIRIRLSQLTPVEAIAVYVNSAVDQSYSPRVMKVKAGTHEGDMTEVAKADIGVGQENGWVLMELSDQVEDGKKADATPSAQDREKDTKKPQHPRQASDDGETATQPLPYSAVAAVLGKDTAPAAAAGPASPLAAAGRTVADRWLWCTMMDICICENQFNGRDCHLRGICLTGPRYEELERGQLDEDGMVGTMGGGGLQRTAAASARFILSGVRHVDQPTEGNGLDRGGVPPDWPLR
ncbi:Anaphase promoting complex subunit 10-like protein [Leptomonas pyrrhocoris]|uniref:Anaphase promoting complex subunit 10-like protein n=1 Tax=Leptomonas pyrrhocoris TaxID=157538 RepID=A0A0M9FTE9_LEPPY|nr:Anaphase promoting complex subunit 10-like protein [Leptomonas pyrrhocoris]KPA75506.1 Anaphase promoting complex subunit 10-like protein [Leptomonas pyrrhocoris]|eukprot:XP_015653945.1 Anaphase promoting complex subunit 10-like protein [Leptomonas pyrrhocoris]